MVNYIRSIKFGLFSSSFKLLTKPHLPEQNHLTVKVLIGRALLYCKPQLKLRWPGNLDVDVDALLDNSRKILRFVAVDTDFRSSVQFVYFTSFKR